MASSRLNPQLRYEPEERCSPLLSLMVGVQGILLVLAPTVVVTAVTVLSAGQSEDYLTWAIFAALIIIGMVTALQASRIWRLGAGHVVITGTTPNYIAVSILALNEGGPAMLASLIVISALFFCAVATWLPLLRRIITPVVSGTLLMLLAVLILPFALDRLQEAPEGAPDAAALGVATVTIAVSMILALRAPRRWRPWALVLGIGSGCVAAALFGIYELESLYAAAWIGVPRAGFPGLDFTPAAGFWALLPMFLIVTLVQAIKGVGDGMAIQQVSRRRPGATDYRLLQGSLYANGIGTLLSGIAGTPPMTYYSSLTASLVNLTGVAARSVGYAIAALVVVMAFFPKLTGALLTIPSPVMGGFLLIALGLLFMEGIQSIMRDGLDVSKTFIVGLSFAAGAGMQHHNVFAGLLIPPWDALLGNGLTVGTLTAVALTAFMELTGPRTRRLQARLDFSDLPKIDAFLKDIAGKMGWNESSTVRLRSAGEETLSSLLQPGNLFSEAEPENDPPRLVISARPDGRAVDLEFVSVLEEENLGDRLAYLEDESETVDEREISFRLLRHYASSVKHQKYHGLDIVTVRVEG